MRRLTRYTKRKQRTSQKRRKQSTRRHHGGRQITLHARLNNDKPNGQGNYTVTIQPLNVPTVALKSYALPKKKQVVWATPNETAKNNARAYQTELNLQNFKEEIESAQTRMIFQMLKILPSTTDEEKDSKEEIRRYLARMKYYPMRQAVDNKNQDYMAEERERMLQHKPAGMSTEEFYKLLDNAVDALQEYRYKKIQEFWGTF